MLTPSNVIKDIQDSWDRGYGTKHLLWSIIYPISKWLCNIIINLYPATAEYKPSFFCANQHDPALLQTSSQHIKFDGGKYKTAGASLNIASRQSINLY